MPKTRPSPPVGLSIFVIFLLSVLIVVPLFLYKDVLGIYFWIFYLLVFPIIMYVSSVAFALYGQYRSCGSVNIPMAVQGGLYMLLGVAGALGISQFAVARAPITSVVPYGTMKGIDSVLEIEKGVPGVEAAAVCYYMFWGISLGQLCSLGASTVCPS